MSLGRIGGWEVLDARSAENALAAVRSGLLDAVLLDVTMPAWTVPARWSCCAW